ncbi:phosphoribosylformylglycinamidine synthase subunit PurL [Candidatus Micrarchaeota archaeon]|nr:phosphoribosylformylglycinamidine synthase subunit PurL [Candidatus Micrarchaeota archaeon]
MQQRVEISIKSGLKDVEGERLSQRISKDLGVTVVCHFIEVYNFEHPIDHKTLTSLASEVFADVIVNDSHVSSAAFSDCTRIEVGLLPGVTDNVGKTASVAVSEFLGKSVSIYYSRMFAFEGKVRDSDLEKIARMLHNPLMEKFHVYYVLEIPAPYLPIVKIPNSPSVQKVNLNLPKSKLESLTKERLLALTLDELLEIKTYLKDSRIIAQREALGLGSEITDVELEAIAQTWSEHCKHKIFNAQITYEENGEVHAINSLFKTFIKAATEQTKKPYVISVFKDNGGIIKFNHNTDVAIKVETHNSPSALDPYGGALTGVLGVQRDILGTGLGANPIANIDVLCFGQQNAQKQDLPKGVLHPKVIFDGVVKGVEHGGNKMGIPTVNGSIVFEREFNTRPLVYCGTVGIMPSEIDGRRTSEKFVEDGYLAIMVGGRIGKDGIHGATFSSMQLDPSVPQSVVQIGDPITQKKMLDFIIQARDQRLFEAITDNGAGGISSSIGEMAQFSNGCEIYLDKAPLKYPGLDPWEILVSESQERMTLAIKPQYLEQLLELAKVHDVEATVVGKFTNSGKFHVLYNNKTVAYLDLEFLHEGVPQLKLKASWKRLSHKEPEIPSSLSYGEVLKSLLSSPNITSKDRVVRSYDHEVKGMSIIKPIMSGPCDAGVIRPIYSSYEGLVIAHGICPKYVQDSYHMASMAFDEAIRNAIACGAKFGYLAALDNFSWPDPVKSEKTPDGEQKLGALVRACLATYDCAINYGVPLVSGKDSMKNDYYSSEGKFSILPTLLITVIGKIDDIRKALTSDFKKPGSFIYVLGKTRAELGGSEFFRLFNGVGDKPPQVYPDEHVNLYRALSAAIEEGLVQSAHDVSDGGIAVAFAECSLGSFMGAEVDLSLARSESEDSEVLLFSESAGRFIVSVDPENASRFEEVLAGTLFAKVGRIRGDKRFIIKNSQELLVNESVEHLKEAFNKGV